VLLLVLTIFVSAQIWHEIPSTVVMVQLLIGRLCLLLQSMCVNVPFLFVSRDCRNTYVYVLPAATYIMMFMPELRMMFR
jgi:hypothetical protein